MTAFQDIIEGLRANRYIFAPFSLSTSAELEQLAQTLPRASSLLELSIYIIGEVSEAAKANLAFAISRAKQLYKMSLYVEPTRENWLSHKVLLTGILANASITELDIICPLNEMINDCFSSCRSNLVMSPLSKIEMSSFL